MTETHALPSADAIEDDGTWDPFAQPADQRFVLASTGKRGSVVVMRAWTARQQMAYQDRLTTHIMARDVSGDPTVQLGVMNALLVSSVVRSWSGFPETITREPTELELRRHKGHTRLVELTEPLDLRRIEHLGELPPSVYGELVQLARQVQDPAAGLASLRPPAELEAGDSDEPGIVVDDEGERHLVDPSPTPSTPPARSAARAPRRRASASSQRG